MNSVNYIYWKLSGNDNIFTIENPLISKISIDNIGKPGFVFFPFSKENNGIFFEGSIEKAKNVTISNFKKNFDVTVNDISKDNFINLVINAVNTIKNNVFKKVVLARSSTVELSKNFNLSVFFFQLCKYYKNSFVYCLKANNELWIGATPELLLKNDFGNMTTYALAGTKSSNKNSLFGEKEIAEQAFVKNYIIEILKNNGSDSINIEESKTLKSGILTHIINKITFKNNNPFKLLKFLHPTPAVCGLPFENSYHFIKENEKLIRSFYSGFLGPVLSENNFNFWVNLRCAKLVESQMILYAGAGITAQSNAKKEWEETENKMKVLRDFINPIG